jgi:hypothetical protein
VSINPSWTLIHAHFGWHPYLLSLCPDGLGQSLTPKATVLDIPVKEPRRPGEVKIGFAKEYGKRSWFQALVGDHVPLIITTSILAAALVIWVIIPSPEKQPPTPTFVGTSSAVSPAESNDPCAFDFVRQHKNCISIPVPSRPTKPDVSRPENPYRDPYRDRVEHLIERPPVFEHPLR